MKRLLLFIPFLLLAFTAFAQVNIFPDSFPRVAGYKAVHVRTDYTYTKPAKKNVLIEKYFFDAAGHTILRLSVCENKTCGRNSYTYSGEQLVSHRNFSSWTPYAKNPEKSKWDSTLLSNEISFQYTGGKLTGYKDYVSSMGGLAFERSFSYDPAGKLKTEDTRTYYDSFTNDLQTVHYALVDRKEYTYQDTVTHIRYNRNNVLTATEELVFLRNGQIRRQTLRSVKGQLIDQRQYRYNDKQQLVEIVSSETGFDGFGNSYDGMGYDRTLFQYDAEGKWTSKTLYARGKLVSQERYEYVK